MTSEIDVDSDDSVADPGQNRNATCFCSLFAARIHYDDVSFVNFDDAQRLHDVRLHDVDEVSQQTCCVKKASTTLKL